VQPWARQKGGGPRARISLRYTIRVEEPPSGPLFLALENPHHFEISLNGRRVSTDTECGWWVDPAIRLVPLDGADLVCGDNKLLLAGTMDDDCNLEACFLLGDMAVRVDGSSVSIAGPVGRVALGDWTTQGLPFYSGNVAFRARVRPGLRDGERLFVEVPEFAGAGVRVLVDGSEAGVLAWPPYEIEVTDMVAGRDEAALTIELLGHRRNAFGPLHCLPVRPESVRPATFATSGEQWQDAYSLVPMGIMAPPRLSVRTAE
jgi:hypothetical protein